MNDKNAYELFIEGKKFSEENEHLRAIMLFEKAISMEPRKGSIREALAASYYNCGFYEYAKINFEKALEIDLSNDFAHYGMGLCLIREGKISKALGHLKIALAMKPSNDLYFQALKKYSRISDRSHKKQC
jgi:tetratricopeptide (TPR) repeat protein